MAEILHATQSAVVDEQEAGIMGPDEWNEAHTLILSATDKLLGRSTAGAGVAEEIACTAAGRALLDDASAAAQLTTLGASAVGHTHDASITDHGALTGLADDDHPQYLLAADADFAELVGGADTQLHSHLSAPVDGDGLLTGGEVAWTADLSFQVSPATYRLDGVEYSSILTVLTLGVADGTNDRIDVIAVNTAGNAVIIAGTPASTPAAPSVDSETQIQLSFVYVAADATEPTGITKTDIYLEDTEWTTSQVGTHFTLASTSNPFDGTKDIEATVAVNTDEVKLVKPGAGTEDITTYNNLIFYLRLKAAWPAAKSLSVSWLNGATQIGSAITVKPTTFGVVNTNTTTYQQVVIPTSRFNATSVVTSLRMRVVGGGTAIGFYLDSISLQGGVVSVSLPDHIMISRGAYNASVSYVQDDVVTYLGDLFIALGSSVGTTPGSNALVWKLLATAPIDPVTTFESFDDFIVGPGATSAGLASRDWADAPPYGTVVVGHPGVVELINSGFTRMRTANTNGWSSFDASENFDITALVLLSNSNVSHADGVNIYKYGMGVAVAGITDHPPSNGCYLEIIDGPAGSANWFAVTRASDTQTRTDSAVANTINSWQKVRMWRSSATQISFAVDGITVATHTANIPTGNLYFTIWIKGSGGGSAKMQVDYTLLRVTDISRA